MNRGMESSSCAVPASEGTDSLPNREAVPDDTAPARPAVPTTCIETIGGDPATAIRLSFQIKVF